MNDEEIMSIKFLKLKYIRGDQIIQSFCKIGSRQKSDPCSLASRNFQTQWKVLLNYEEYIEI